MKFKFPLQKVLDHRQMKENMAQKDFQEALMVLNELNAKLAELEGALHEAHLRAGSLQSQGGAQGPALSQINEFQNYQKILIQRQKEKVLQQEKGVEEKRSLLRQAVVETKIISRFKEKKFEEYKHEVAVSEQREMEEQSILRFKPKGKREAEE